MRRHSLLLAVLSFAVLAAVLLSSTGCNADPHDTHVRTAVGVAR